MKVYDPTGVGVRSRSNDLPNVVESLAGKTIGILSNVWPSFEGMVARFRERLPAEFKTAKINYYLIPRTRAADDALLDKIVEECDAAIVGLGN